MKIHPSAEKRDFARADHARANPLTRPILVSSLGFVPSRSPDASPIYDPQLAAGLRFMCEHAFESITVNDIVRVAGISRRVFERRFARLNLVGRSPKAEMMRLRLERAKELLAKTNWTLAQIAEKTGFKYAEHLHVMFSQKIGITPGKFRQIAKRKSER